MEDSIEHTTHLWRPRIFDPADAADRQAMEQLRVWQRHDTIYQQLRDLVEINHPHQESWTDDAMLQAIEALTGGNWENTGRWVYYPWSGNLVHLLAKADFQRVRLNRNQHKIRPDEQQRLLNAKVGIVGLSVGNAIALTLALEGVGHLVLADHDSLDLSNMNRLRCTTPSLGVPKVVIAARQIAEIDPYLSIDVYEAWVDEHNLPQFLDGLDVLVDECDSFDVKLKLRHAARQRRIPVVMDATDRGLLDVERFDLEPERAIFHGMLGDVDPDAFAVSDKKDQVAALMKLLGVNNITTAGAASLLEIGSSIKTWPQLAADVACGAASVTMVARRILLEKPVASCHRRVDLESRVAGEDPTGVVLPPIRPGVPETTHDLSQIPTDIKAVVEAATLAPSGGNSQPWAFAYDGEGIWVEHDQARAENLMDFDHRASMIGIGAATENATIKAASLGLTLRNNWDPTSTSIARWTLLPGAAAPDTLLLAALGTRITNRHRSDDTLITPDEMAALAGEVHGVHFASTRGQMVALAKLLGRTDRVRFLNPSMHPEMVGEFRWTDAQAEETGDGMQISSLELDGAEQTALRILSRPDVAAELRKWDGGRGLERLVGDRLAGSSGAVAFTIKADTRAEWLDLGRAVQRLWLRATQLGIGCQPVGTGLFMRRMADASSLDVFNDQERQTIRDATDALPRVFGIESGKIGFLLRLSHPVAPPTSRSPRRPLTAVLRKV